MRGYASLLILRALMNRVRDFERDRTKRAKQAQKIVVQPLPSTSSSDDAGEDERSLDNEEDNDSEDTDDGDGLQNSSAAYCWASGLPTPSDPTDGVPNYEKTYLPHHYFDYFFGTSTGG